jgi:hypothetical protein
MTAKRTAQELIDIVQAAAELPQVRHRVAKWRLNAGKNTNFSDTNV